MADPAFRAEFEQWTSASPGRRDWIPLSASGPPTHPQDRWVPRDYRRGVGPARVPAKDLEENPLLAVLTSHLSGPTADVQADQALQRVLLTATADGLAASLLSHIVEVPKGREELHRLISATRPAPGRAANRARLAGARHPRREVGRPARHESASCDDRDVAASLAHPTGPGPPYIGTAIRPSLPRRPAWRCPRAHLPHATPNVTSTRSRPRFSVSRRSSPDR